MKKALVAVFGISLLVLPLIASAQGTDPVVAICNILNVIKNILLAVGLGIAVIILIVGGIQYMTAGGDAEKAKAARGLIVNAIIGIAIIFAAAFILALVQGFLTSSGVSMFQNPCGP